MTISKIHAAAVKFEERRNTMRLILTGVQVICAWAGGWGGILPLEFVKGFFPI